MGFCVLGEFFDFGIWVVYRRFWDFVLVVIFEKLFFLLVIVIIFFIFSLVEFGFIGIKVLFGFSGGGEGFLGVGKVSRMFVGYICFFCFIDNRMYYF